MKMTIVTKLRGGGSKKVGFMGIAKIKAVDLEYMASLLESGKVKSAIEKVYSLEEGAQALQYIGPKHTRGKIVVRVS